MLYSALVDILPVQQLGEKEFCRHDWQSRILRLLLNLHEGKNCMVLQCQCL